MPTYQYDCTKCNKSFDEMYSIAERTVPESEPCPNCKETNCIKLSVGAVALVSPFAIDGLIRPPVEFRERMSQIKHGHKNVKSLQGKFKDY